MEDAREEIRILTGKLQRREEALAMLRRKISVDVLNYKVNGGDELTITDMRSKFIEESKAEDVKILELQEILNQLRKLNEEKDAEIERLKSRLRLENIKFKDRTMSTEKQTIMLQEQVHKLENEKRVMMTALSNKDAILERNSKEIEFLRQEVQANSKVVELEKLNKRLSRQLLTATQDLNDKEATISKLKEDRDAQIESKASVALEELTKK